MPERPPRWYPLLVLAGFCTTIVWLDLLANEVVAIIESFGLVSGISTSILGLTVIAVGNSIGDFVADTAAAKGSDVRMAVAACFGSPLLMNIIGVGTSLTLRMLTTGGSPTWEDSLVIFASDNVGSFSILGVVQVD